MEANECLAASFDDGHVWLDKMQLQLQWLRLRQPASLLRLLQRPVLLDAWLRGEEEEHASFLWRSPCVPVCARVCCPRACAVCA